MTDSSHATPAHGPTEAGIHFLLPYWGDPALLHATVASVLAQTDPRWHLTIVDDGYPDDEARRTYQAHPDDRIDYRRNEVNLGVAGNFEHCRTLVAAPLATFLGSDDLLDPEFTTRALRAFAEHPGTGILQPGVRVADADGRTVEPLGDRIKRYLSPRAPRPLDLSGEALALSLMRGNWLYWPSLVFDAGLLARHSFRQDLPIILDLAIIMDMVVEGAVLRVDDGVSFTYRRHAASASSESLVGGSRLADERRYFREAAQQLRRRGWNSAARVASLRAVSRLHALTSLPAAVRLSLQQRSTAAVAEVARHAFSR